MAVIGRRRQGSIDWEAVRARMARAIAATESSFSPSPEETRRIMDARARALARAPEVEKDAGQQLEILVFSLANERYAIETRFVRKLLRISELTPVPGTPGFIRGIVNLQGEMLAAIDLKAFLGSSSPQLSDLTRLIVLGEDRAEFGLLADELHEVAPLSSTQLLESPSDAGPVKDHVKGVTSDALVLLDGGGLLHDRRLFVEQRDQPLPSFGESM